MKNLILIFALFNIFNSNAQSIEKSLFNVMDVFIEKEIVAKSKDKDKVLLEVNFFKGKEGYVINLSAYNLDLKQLQNIDTIYNYKGIKAIVFLRELPNDIKNQISNDFEIFEKDNIKKSFEKYGNDNDDGVTFYCPFAGLAVQFNKKNKIYFIYSGSDKEYYKLLKGKVQFAKKVQFSPPFSYEQ